MLVLNNDLSLLASVIHAAINQANIWTHFPEHKQLARFSALSLCRLKSLLILIRTFSEHIAWRKTTFFGSCLLPNVRCISWLVCTLLSDSEQKKFHLALDPFHHFDVCYSGANGTQSEFSLHVTVYYVLFFVGVCRDGVDNTAMWNPGCPHYYLHRLLPVLAWTAN